MNTAETTASLPVRPRSRKWITAALMMVMVLASFETTITATAMPTIVGDLRGIEHYAWVATVYLLASTLSMPLYGRLADIFGRKRVLLFAIGLFSAGSLLAATSTSMTLLILYRALQGLGAGGIMPVVLTILGDVFTLKERARIQALFSAVWGTAALAGPALGALLVKTLGWPSIFYITLPAAIASATILIITYHEHHQRAVSDEPLVARLDVPGLLTGGIGVTALLAGISIWSNPGMFWLWPTLLLIVALVSLLVFGRLEKAARHPILPPSFLTHRAIGPALIASGTLGVAVFSLDTYVPLYVQAARGGDAAAAAATVTPVMLAWATSGIVAAPLLIRWGFRKLAVVGATLVVGSFAALVICDVVSAPLLVLTAVLFVAGFGFGPSSMASLLSAQEAVHYEQRGLVTSGITFFRNLGGALGIALFGTLFNTLTVAPFAALAKDKPFTPADLLSEHGLANLRAKEPELLRAAQQLTGHALLWVFVAMLVVALVQLVVSRLLPQRSREHVTGVQAEAAAV